MTHRYADRVMVLSSSVGTGDLVLGQAVAGYQTLGEAGVNIGDTCDVCVEDPLAKVWEVTRATLIDADTIARGQIFDTSAGGARIDFGEGLKRIYLVQPGAVIADDRTATEAARDEAAALVAGFGDTVAGATQGALDLLEGAVASIVVDSSTATAAATDARIAADEAVAAGDLAASKEAIASAAAGLAQSAADSTAATVANAAVQRATKALLDAVTGVEGQVGVVYGTGPDRGQYRSLSGAWTYEAPTIPDMGDIVGPQIGEVAYLAGYDGDTAQEVDSDDRVMLEIGADGYRYRAPVMVDDLAATFVRHHGQQVVFDDPAEYTLSLAEDDHELLVDEDYRVIWRAAPPPIDGEMVSTLADVVGPQAGQVQYLSEGYGGGTLQEVDLDERVLLEIGPSGYDYLAPVRTKNFQSESADVGLLVTSLTQHHGQQVAFDDPAEYTLALAEDDHELLVDEDYRIIWRAALSVDQVVSKSAEYDLSGYDDVQVDEDFRIIAAFPAPPGEAVVAEAVDEPIAAIYTVVDGNGHTQVVAEDRASGTATQLSSAGSNNSAPVLLAPDIVAWSSDRAGAAPRGYYSRLSAPRERALVPYPTIYCWGDSLTAAAGGYPARLSTALGGRTVVNRGVSGQQSSEIVARAGAIPSRFAVAGNAIPASGGVAVTSRSIELVTSGGPAGGITGSLAGVHGSLTRAGDGTITFTRTAPGIEVSCPAGTPFIPDTDGWEECTAILWAGRNNRAKLLSQMEHFRAWVGFIASYTRRFVVVPMTGASDEPAGSPAYLELLRQRDALFAEWPANVCDVRPVINAAYDPGIPQDVIDHANDVPPSSLRIDTLHYTGDGYQIIADTLAAFIIAKGW